MDFPGVADGVPYVASAPAGVVGFLLSRFGGRPGLARLSRAGYRGSVTQRPEAADCSIASSASAARMASVSDGPYG